MIRPSSNLLLALSALAYAPYAHAHVCMDAPVSRVGPNCTFASAQKPGPCGINTRSTQYLTTFRPGETITVALNETIDHPSHYRIAFNPNGASFEDPTGIDDKSGKHPFVLLDGIMDESAAKQSVKVTLPNVTCDKCTLQLIQVMYDKQGNGFGNDDIYYSCADLVLAGAPMSGADAGASDAGSGGDAGSASDASTARDAGDPVRPAFDAGSPPVDLGGGARPGTGVDGGNTGTALPDSGHGHPDGPGAGAPDAAGAGQAPTMGDAGAPPEEDEDGGCSVARPGAKREMPLGLLLALSVVALAIHRCRLGRRAARAGH